LAQRRLAARYRTGMDGTVLSADAGGVVEGVFPTYAQALTSTSPANSKP